MKAVLNTSSKSGTIMDRVQSFEAACKELGIMGEITIEISDNANRIFSFLENSAKAAIVTEALNEGWQADWNDSEQQKWYIWFNMKTSAFGLDLVDCYCERSDVPSRLCFRTRELAEHAAKYFLDLYKSLFLTY